MTTCRPEEPHWVPPTGTEVELLPLGQWCDAVKVPLRIGEFALKLLAYDTGAVIEDSFGAHLYWLVRPDTAAGWLLQHITVLGRTCYLAVPPAHRTDGAGLRWLVPYEKGHALTDPDSLYEALDAGIHTLTGPRGQSDR